IQKIYMTKIRCICCIQSYKSVFCTGDTTEGDYIEKVEHTNTKSVHIDYLPVDEVIVNHGYERDTSLLDNSEIDIERKESYFIASNAKGESSVPGLYAAGDILMHDGKLNLIAGAFQDAA